MFAIKRRLKLNKSEESLMAQHAGFSRFVYNYGLDLFWQSLYIKASDSKRIKEIKKCFTNITKKRPEYQWTLNLSSTVYQSAFQHLQQAFSSWRKGISKAPTFKSKKDGPRFTVYNCNGLSLVSAGKKIKLPTLGTKLDIVDRWYPSSKQCRMCKQKNDGLKLSDRIFVCSNPSCGHTEDRDLHAALNLGQVSEKYISSRVGTIRN